MGRLSWTTLTQRVDQDTGELITERNAKTNYLLIKTVIQVTHEKGINIRRITKIYGKNPQGKFW